MTGKTCAIQAVIVKVGRSVLEPCDVTTLPASHAAEVGSFLVAAPIPVLGTQEAYSEQDDDIPDHAETKASDLIATA